MFSKRIQATLCTVVFPCLALAACAAGGEGDGDDGTDGNPVIRPSGGAPGSGGASAGAPGSGGNSSGGGTGGVVDEDAEPLPLVVTSIFAPSGFMGREGTVHEVEGITMEPEGCPERAEGAVGLCYVVEYQPQELDANSGETWAGVFFQNPDGNWGEEPGVLVESGATKVSFVAWSASPSLDINFLAGGIGSVGTAYADKFKVEKGFTITSTPTTYELDLRSSTYDRVLGGFGWVVRADSLDTIEFYIDDVRWEK